ncbi:MAG: hypothetical protein ABII76_24755 [Pseudomonadota bacterium]
MSFFGWIPLIVNAILAVTTIINWKHAKTARAIGDVLIETIEKAPIGSSERADVKGRARNESERAGVAGALHARVKAVTEGSK